MAKKVTFLTQFFYPEPAATAQLLTELAVELVQRGWEVTVYTAQPTYHERKRLPRKERFHGVQIIRLFSTRFPKQKLWGRLANGLTFLLAALVRVLFTQRRDPLLIVSAPPFLGCVGWLAWLVRRRRYVFLVHDVYPDVAVRLGYMKEGGVVARIWDMLNRKVYGHAGAVIVLGERMKRTVETRIKNRATPVVVIHNWADGSFVVPRGKEDNWFARKHGLIDKTVVLYSGNLGLFHDLETIIEAADRLRDVDDVVFLFIGGGGKKEKLVRMVREKGLRNVMFLPYQPREHLPFSLTAGDIGVVTLERGVEGLCVPSKLYYYLAAGQAILALVGKESEVADIVESWGCGVRVDQGDVDSVVSVLTHWVKDRSLLIQTKANSRKCFEACFTKEQAVTRYEEVLRTLEGEGGTS